MNIYAKKGTPVRYIGASEEAIRWGDNTDPRGYLNEGQIYFVDHTEVHSSHTYVYLEDMVGKFNSVHFEDVIPNKE